MRDMLEAIAAHPWAAVGLGTWVLLVLNAVVHSVCETVVEVAANRRYAADAQRAANGAQRAVVS